MKTLNVILMFSAGLWMSGCKGEELQSTWKQLPVTIDGNTDEWEHAQFVVSEDEHLALGVENDSTYLYLVGRVSDANAARAIERVGVTLWIDADGGDSKDLEIRFPVGRSADFRQARGGFWGSLTEGQRSRASKGLNEMRRGVLVIDNRSVTSHVYSPGSAGGFGAEVGKSSGITAFEVRIPISLHEHVADVSSVGSKGKVGVGIQLGGFGGGPEENLGGGRQGMGQWGGRGRGGFGRFPQRGQMGASATEIWVEVSLASPK